MNRRSFLKLLPCAASVATLNPSRLLKTTKQPLRQGLDKLKGDLADVGWQRCPKRIYFIDEAIRVDPAIWRRLGAVR